MGPAQRRKFDSGVTVSVEWACGLWAVADPYELVVEVQHLGLRPNLNEDIMMDLLLLEISLQISALRVHSGTARALQMH